MKRKILLLLTILLCIAGCQNKTDNLKKKQHDYVPNENYFSLIDEGYATPVKNQIKGTCWVFAETSAMESNYFVTNHKQIEIDPIELLNKIYSGKDDGYYIGSDDTRLNNGGWPWLTIGTMANGLGSYVLKSAKVYKDVQNEAIKDVIKKYGAVSVETNDGSKKSIDNYVTMHDTSQNFDHEVILVGWDDNFPKDYFSPSPKNNGAWLAQNSMSENWGENGTYWISYESPFISYTSFSISDEYKEVIHYDVGNEGSFSLGSSTTIGNVFKHSGKLKAIGIFTANDNEEVEINIYSEKFNKLLATKKEKLDKIGYYVIDLDSPIKVDDFSISVKYKGKACVEGETSLFGSIKYTTNINKGESFVFINNQWKDMSDDDIKNVLNIDFNPNNCCIKALFD